ncbi:MAG: hypothetical protein R3D85_03165 [Paracoccaceae bacterium]
MVSEKISILPEGFQRLALGVGAEAFEHDLLLLGVGDAVEAVLRRLVEGQFDPAARAAAWRETS